MKRPLTAAEAIGVVVPAGYTFVCSHVWPRAADPCSTAAELRTTAALSSLRAIARRDAIDADDAITASCLHSEIHGMQHNTDGVVAKLEGLDARICQSTES
jgi:hypothetical protein